MILPDDPPLKKFVVWVELEVEAETHEAAEAEANLQLDFLIRTGETGIVGQHSITRPKDE